ncbi:hypothetical protein ACET3Z_014554 [Daucus carota]
MVSFKSKKSKIWCFRCPASGAPDSWEWLGLQVKSLELEGRWREYQVRSSVANQVKHWLSDDLLSMWKMDHHRLHLHTGILMMRMTVIRRVAQLRIHPVKLRRYSIRSGPSRASAAPGTGMPTNPFNFSVVAGLLNDPSVKELAEQIAQDPSFNQIAEQLKKSFEGARAGDGIPQVDPQQYFSSVQQVMQNPQLMTMAERLGSALMQDPSMSQILESLNNPAQQDQLQERM